MDILFKHGLVSLDFIQTADAEHIRGTECDQKILSKKESRGQVRWSERRSQISWLESRGRNRITGAK
jgi:hypothetical protein